MTDWQPIETAPKDCTPIDVLLNGKARVTDVTWNSYEGRKGEQYGWVDELNMPVIWEHDNCNKVTHWMPLPEPPKERG